MLIQKRIIRSIKKETYLAHTCPLFKTCNILKLQDVRSFLLAQHIFKNRNIFITYNDAHIYNTRQANNLVPLFQRLSVSQRSITFAGPATWNQLPDDLRECGSFFVFKHRLKQFLLAQYDGVDWALLPRRWRSVSSAGLNVLLTGWEFNYLLWLPLVCLDV